MIAKTKNIKIILIVSIIFFIIFILGYGVYCFFYNINNLPVGHLISSEDSPTHEYTLKAYLINGGSLSANAIRVELLNIATKKIKNIYWEYPKSDVKMKWLDNTNVEINGIKLNVLKDAFDWRKNS